MAFIYVPVTNIGDVPNLQGAAAAALCAGEQGKFWEFHDALFDWLGEFGAQAFTNNRISSGVDALGMDHGAFNSCIGSSRPSDILDAAQTLEQGLLNFIGTPTFTINGIVPLDDSQQPVSDANGILARIDAEMARITAPPATAEVTPETTATAESTAEATAQATESATEPATAEATAGS